MRLCTRCVLPGIYRNIHFDANGICNYCHTYDRLRTRLTDFEALSALGDERFERVRGRYPYDCLIGLSGGKDSSWIALQLVRKKKLKCLGFTFDNGFLTDYARSNIRLVAERLGIEHFFYEVDWDIHKRFYEQAVRWFGTPCPGCSYSSYALSYKIAFERQIPLVVHGRSRSQMFRELLAGSPDAFLPFVKLNISPYEREKNLQATLEARMKIERFISIAMPNRVMRQRFYDEFFPPTDELRDAAMIPEFLGYFLYQYYDEGAMMDELDKELGWERPDRSGILTHADCAVHDAAEYLYRQVFGYPMVSFELSVLVREGDLPREEALKLLAEQTGRESVPDESLDYLCEQVSIQRGELAGICKRLRRQKRWRNRLLRIKNFLLRPKLDL